MEREAWQAAVHGSHRVEHDGTCEHANVHLQTKYTVVYINHISPMSDGNCSGKSFQP